MTALCLSSTSKIWMTSHLPSPLSDSNLSLCGIREVEGERKAVLLIRPTFGEPGLFVNEYCDIT